MALEFNCPSCGEIIVVKYLGPGETAKCRNCGSEAVVPADALKAGEEPRYVRPKEKRESAGAGAAASLPSKEQAAQDALASFFIGMAPFLGGLPGLMFLWVFAAPYGLSLASRGKKSENRLFAQIGQILCVAGLVMYGLGIIIGIILVIIQIKYMPRP
jgi:hypothetical protein